MHTAEPLKLNDKIILENIQEIELEQECQATRQTKRTDGSYIFRS